ncbi:NO-inducible flavohemoprotein [Dyadobacter luteus]|jgi:nitric oxide dioxygenase|uniref:Flavohemoprotein n=1 Tax=Dyadobacter luteus TaxID=2259619 RepID=A0A3D8YFD5_9BACT|nr:NO-inducible flavohemoprotein [Dyadobacter luteus]REA63292.1 NO-inducible flavohemoprotein [Dyadobacter luteus]
METKHKELVKATVPVLKEHGVLLTTHFYRRVFSFNPELKNTFNMGNQQNGKQQTALAMAVLAYAEHIDNPSVLLPVLEKIGHKHTSLDIRPEHYDIIGRHLLASIGEVLGDAATPELIEAWTMAYGQLAGIMAGTEARLYANQVNRENGWTGWRPFIVKDKIEESAEITSFHLYPADGGKVPDHVPGQFLSIRLFLPELNLLQPRQYSISNAPNQLYFRISVKREKGTELDTDGMISNRLHDFVNPGDRVEVSAPAGDFVLNQDSENPVVFISGGVGQTPLVSMLESLLQKSSTRPITWVHGCRSESVHAFKDTVDYLAGEYPNLKQHIFYNEKNQLSDQSVIQGIVDLSHLEETALVADAEFYLCGPSPFISKQYHDLRNIGIAKEAIHFEEFGPAVLTLN